jgi:NAD(P)-dependent dehydrogenase (short-subunit alcohol dehydrogenase family)
MMAKDRESNLSLRKFLRPTPQINILANNLGINPKLTFLLDIEESIWDRVMETNLKGYLLASQIGGRNMRDHGGGIIINISSFEGIQSAPA